MQYRIWLLAAWYSTAPLSVSIREKRAGDLTKQSVRNPPVHNGCRRATWNGSNIGARPEKSIRFRGYDPRRRVIKTDPALDFLRKRDGVVGIGTWGMRDGKDEDLGASVVFFDGEG